MTHFATISGTEFDDKRLSSHDGAPAPYVLVVDDDRLVADTLTQIVRAGGYGAATAYDGEAALSFAELVPPEILLSDIGMPGMDGFELAVRLCQLIGDCEILLISADDQAQRIAEAHRAGHRFHFMQKPFDPANLLLELAAIRAAAHDKVPDCPDPKLHREL